MGGKNLRVACRMDHTADLVNTLSAGRVGHYRHNAAPLSFVRHQRAALFERGQKKDIRRAQHRRSVIRETVKFNVRHSSILLKHSLVALNDPAVHREMRIPVGFRAAPCLEGDMQTFARLYRAQEDGVEGSGSRSASRREGLGIEAVLM